MKEQRWLRIIPVALIMYTISYIDRTNVALALDPNISTMMRDLAMTDKLKGLAGGIFFFGYVLLQIPGGHLGSGLRIGVELHPVCRHAFPAGCGGERRISGHSGAAGQLVSARRAGAG